MTDRIRWSGSIASIVCALAIVAHAVTACAQEQSPAPAAQVSAGVALTFPKDHAAHPEFRTEWWYITGVAETQEHRFIGFQVTFFRSRPDLERVNPSRFSPTQLLFAHAAIADPQTGHLLHAQRAARAGFGLASASATTCDVSVDRWTLKQAADGSFDTHVDAPEFSLALHFSADAPVMLNGDAGFSQKGPDARDASFYYSMPQLQVSGSITAGQALGAVRGEAWLDHEWSSSYLDTAAQGWDWVGINLSDGGALMAFQMRDLHGAPLWSGASLRQPDGEVTVYPASQVRFKALRWWKSERTGVSYPVEQEVDVGEHSWRIAAAMNDQELDASGSTGTLYWEGWSKATPTDRVTRPVGTPPGEGYLELTGYDHRLAL